MARQRNASASDDGRDTDLGVNSAVTRDVPKIEVEILDDVHARIEGKEVLPGETALVDGTLAINLVMLGHAKIVGSTEPKKAKR